MDTYLYATETNVDYMLYENVLSYENINIEEYCLELKIIANYLSSVYIYNDLFMQIYKRIAFLDKEQTIISMEAYESIADEYLVENDIGSSIQNYKKSFTICIEIFGINHYKYKELNIKYNNARKQREQISNIKDYQYICFDCGFIWNNYSSTISNCTNCTSSDIIIQDIQDIENIDYNYIDTIDDWHDTIPNNYHTNDKFCNNSINEFDYNKSKLIIERNGYTILKKNNNKSDKNKTKLNKLESLFKK